MNREHGLFLPVVIGAGVDRTVLFSHVEIVCIDRSARVRREIPFDSILGASCTASSRSQADADVLHCGDARSALPQTACDRRHRTRRGARLEVHDVCFGIRMATGVLEERTRVAYARGGRGRKSSFLHHLPLRRFILSFHYYFLSSFRDSVDSNAHKTETVTFEYRTFLVTLSFV